MLGIALRLLSVLFVSSLLAGCARYEYDLVQPADLARHVGSKSDVQLNLDPLRYHLRSKENRLVMQIYNPTQDPIRLLGEQSFVVDPEGESRPLRGRTIAPDSRIKEIFPPFRPRIEPRGPTIGIGVGTRIGRASYPYSHHALSRQPLYFDIYDSDALYWDWNGETDARMTLTYQRGDETFQHHFIFHRRKM